MNTSNINNYYSKYKNPKLELSKTVKESKINQCQYCGSEIDKGKIFCDLHNTVLNKQIYEFFVDAPFRPRGGKFYEVIKYYLSCKFELENDRRIIVKSISGVGKSLNLDMLAYLELTHFPNSLTVIGSVSDSVSKEHIMRLRNWISNSIFNRYIHGTQDATASKTEIQLAKLNSRIISIPQSEKTRCTAAFTELLTHDGWKEARYIKQNEFVLTWNKEKDQLEWQRCINSKTFHYKGDMVHFKNGRSLDMLVTPNHRMVYKSAKFWLVKTAKELLDLRDFLVPFTARECKGDRPEYFYLKGKKYPIFPFLTLLGYYVSEGNVRRDGKGIQIAQSIKSEYFTRIKDCISSLNYPVRYIKSSKIFYFIDKELAFWLKANCGNISHNKRVPKFLFKLDAELISVFLRAYIEGDGDKRDQNAETKSEQLADDIQALWTLIGKSASISWHKNKNLKCVYSKLQFRQGQIKTKTDAKIEKYDGDISCIQVDNSFLIYRLNGCISISGNSGWHPSLLLIDEVGRMRSDAYYTSFFQMGRMTGRTEILSSTPFGSSIVMQEIWNSEHVKKIDISVDDCWWISKEELRKAQNEMPPEKFDQIYAGKFRSYTNRVIPDDILLNAISLGTHIESTTNNLVMGVDFGRKIDMTAIVLLDIETGDVKYAEQFNDEWQIQFAKIRKIYKDWNPIALYVDKSSIGDVVMSELSDLPIQGVSMHNDVLKKRVIDKLIMAFMNQKINIVADEFPVLVNQLSSYIYMDSEHKSMGPATRSEHDDQVVALALTLGSMDVTSYDRNQMQQNLWNIIPIRGSDRPQSMWKISKI
jgi:hypothetical protein